jgi:hypothetical protein
MDIAGEYKFILGLVMGYTIMELLENKRQRGWQLDKSEN